MKSSFEKEDEIKSCLDKQKLGEVVASRPAL